MSVRNTRQTPHWEQTLSGFEWFHPLYGVAMKTRAEHKFKFDFWAIPDEMDRSKKAGPFLTMGAAKDWLKERYERKLREQEVACAANP